MRHKNTHLAQTLRKNQTKEEAKIWYQFLRKYPLQFRRQFQFGNYIVDFYCAKAKLVVELDGSQHYDPQKISYDTQRTEYLQSLGLKVLRYANNEINKEFEQVCQSIDTEVKSRYFEG
ncbi:MAG: endonuclease domain-containing protein [Oscillospiraceae bacterium]|nr:endonuclease domain-containing protein [Oscillospiraceae bacterium]